MEHPFNGTGVIFDYHSKSYDIDISYPSNDEYSQVSYRRALGHAWDFFGVRFAPITT